MFPNFTKFDAILGVSYRRLHASADDTSAFLELNAYLYINFLFFSELRPGTCTLETGRTQTVNTRFRSTFQFHDVSRPRVDHFHTSAK